MGLFTKKPTTVSAVFEKAVADVRVIQTAQDAEAAKLEQEQKERAEKLDKEKAALEATFKTESTTNAEAKATADKESEMAGKVITKFSELFGIETTDA